VTAGEASERRRRAFTIFSRAYKDAQRAVAYLRADFEDAEQIAPSIFPGRPGRRGATGEKSAAPVSEASGEVTSVQERVAAAVRNHGNNNGTGNASASFSVDPNGLPITPPLVS
jgi:hypothetical protein